MSRAAGGRRLFGLFSFYLHFPRFFNFSIFAFTLFCIRVSWEDGGWRGTERYREGRFPSIALAQILNSPFKVWDEVMHEKNVLCRADLLQLRGRSWH
jgi:hypothetical protein